ncbi:MAG TPA: FlhC family transcriptional regulator [Steroidobacteraceae bacterium]|nr:FlhC family transcriptional regulator [Steroidobacteraceae bacterium]
MHISNERYFHDRQRHDLALRMIRHEARTCTIRSCTGLTDDRIRRLYKTYASHMPSAPVRRRRGKSPRQVAFFVRNARAQLESSMLASVFATFGLWRAQSNAQLGMIQAGSIEFGRLFCDAYETHRQLLRNADISFEHAWFLLQLLSRNADLHAVRCRHCDSQYLRDRVNLCRRTCPVCTLKRTHAERR